MRFRAVFHMESGKTYEGHLSLDVNGPIYRAKDDGTRRLRKKVLRAFYEQALSDDGEYTLETGNEVIYVRDAYIEAFQLSPASEGTDETRTPDDASG
jgi:hypothetical protein